MERREVADKKEALRQATVCHESLMSELQQLDISCEAMTVKNSALKAELANAKVLPRQLY